MIKTIYSIIVFLLIVPKYLGEDPTTLNLDSYRDRQEALEELIRHRMEQSNLFQENGLLNGSYSNLTNATLNFSVPSESFLKKTMEERLKKIKTDLPQILSGLKCYASEEECVSEGCEEHQCLPCMDWQSRSPGFRCLKKKNP